MKKLLLALVILFTLNAQAQCWKQIEFGSGFGIAIKDDGTLWAWGINNHGQLGDGTTVQKSSPVQVGTASDWQEISVGGSSVSLALKTDGTIWAWGDTTMGQIPGSNSMNQLIPLKIGTETNWKKISCGGWHMLAIKEDGTLWAWGFNDNGALGLGHTEQVNSPQQVDTATDYSAIAAGLSASYALKTNGTLWSWGGNDYGQLGNGAMNGSNPGGPNVLIPTQVGADTHWKIIDGGSEHIAAQKEDNTLWSWGSNFSGELGNGTTVASSVPVQIGNDAWISFSAGYGGGSGIKADGKLYKWGLQSQTSPTEVNGSTDWSKVVASGLNTNCAVKANGEMYMSGSNTLGQLGLGDTVNHPEPALFGTSCEETTGLNDNTLAQITLYPNPTSNTLTLANAENLNIEKLTVIDLTGKTVMTQNSNASQIDVQQLPTGMYFLNVSASEGVQHLKFIKQ